LPSARTRPQPNLPLALETFLTLKRNDDDIYINVKVETCAMKSDFKNLTPLQDDPIEMRKAINALNGAKINYERKNEHHLKVGKFNFYPVKGTIYCDRDKKPLCDRGLDAFMHILEKEKAHFANIAEPPAALDLTHLRAESDDLIDEPPTSIDLTHMRSENDQSPPWK
jgi:hypothetical protein